MQTLITLTSLSDAALITQTREVARREQSYSLLLIEHLLEVDARKLYACEGFDSLFKYVVKDLGYSESTAYERIRAMRLVWQVPEAREKLRTGALTLSSAAQVESFRRQERLPEAKARELVEEASYKSLREVEILLLSKSENPIPREKLRQITPELQEAKLILTPEIQGLIRRYEELHGKMPVSEILKTVLHAHLKKHDPLRQSKSTPSRDSDSNGNDSSVTDEISVSAKPCVTATPQNRSRYIGAETKRFLWQRSQGRCEWRDFKTGARCSAKFRLQFDHYPKPFALGGSSTRENLRLVCQAHNARFAVEIYGVGSGNKSQVATDD